MMIALTISALCSIIVAAGFLIRNKLIRSQNLVDSALADIDVNLAKRLQLIPQLLPLVKSYAKYESQLLEDVVNTRVAKEAGSLSAADNSLNKAIKQITITAEDYPELKANDQFIQLMEQMKYTEDDLRFSRQFYNGTVREYNKLRESFPQNIVAGLSGFQPLPLYKIDESQTQTHAIDL